MLQVNQTLLEEITVINHQLIDTVLDISDEDTLPTVASAPNKVGEGTIVRCSFIAVAISRSLKSEQVSAHIVLHISPNVIRNHLSDFLIPILTLCSMSM